MKHKATKSTKKANDSILKRMQKLGLTPEDAAETIEAGLFILDDFKQHFPSQADNFAINSAVFNSAMTGFINGVSYALNRDRRKPIKL